MTLRIATTQPTASADTQLSLSVPEQSANLMRSAIVGPDGSHLASVDATAELAVVTLDRDAPGFHIALDLARPWRAEANQG